MTLELKSGDSFGDFTIKRVVRKLAHAWVYEVDAPGTSEPRELKVSLHPVGSEEAARRALREVAVLERLSNAHVVTVHGTGLGPNDHWYIVLEHLEGAQLDHWHDFDVPLPAADAAGFIHQACLGLAELHAEGIVHRDLNPQRLWVLPDRTLKIMDFSSARSWGGEGTGDNVTVGLALAGSPQYAAPEQTTVPELSPAADVYSLGVILYEMLTGRSPFFPDRKRSQARAELADEPAAWLRAHAQVTPIPVTDHPGGKECPTKLADLVLRCLAKRPEDRPVDAAALANELGWVLHHDLGAAQAAILTSHGPDGITTYHLMLPGSHRLDGRGAPSTDPSITVAAVIEWAGSPRAAEIVPETQAVTVAGEPIQGRSQLPPGAAIRIGATELTLVYPKDRPS